MTSRYDPERIRRRLVRLPLRRMVRVIRQRHRRNPLGARPAPNRFGDPARRYAVLYAAAAVRCAFVEAVVRNRFDRRQRRDLPRSEIDSRLVVSINSAEPVALVDLREDGAFRIGAPTAVVHDANHAAGRALSAATHEGVPAADGFVYRSRFTEHTCVAVFDRAIPKLEWRDGEPLSEQADFLDALSRYDISLTTPPRRSRRSAT